MTCIMTITFKVAG